MKCAAVQTVLTIPGGLLLAQRKLNAECRYGLLSQKDGWVGSLNCLGVNAG